MKKLLTSLFLSWVLTTSLFAQDGTYLCFALSVFNKDGNKKYNFTEKQMKITRVVITIDNHVLSDGHDKFIYLFTAKGLELFKNDKLQITIAIQTMADKGGFYVADMVNKNSIIKLGCKKIK